MNAKLNEISSGIVSYSVLSPEGAAACKPATLRQAPLYLYYPVHGTSPGSFYYLIASVSGAATDTGNTNVAAKVVINGPTVSLALRVEQPNPGAIWNAIVMRLQAAGFSTGKSKHDHESYASCHTTHPDMATASAHAMAVIGLLSGLSGMGEVLTPLPSLLLVSSMPAPAPK